MRLKDKQTGEVGEYFLTNYKRAKIAFVPHGKSPSESIVFDSIKELYDRFEDAPEEKKYGGRVPKESDEYWFLASDGSINRDVWTGGHCDKDRFEVGSAFWTIEETEKELKRRKAYVILKEDTKGFEPCWGLSENKYYVFYDWKFERLATSYAATTKSNGFYFATREDAEASIKAHKQEWLDYLGIEEEAREKGSES